MKILLEKNGIPDTIIDVLNSNINKINNILHNKVNSNINFILNDNSLKCSLNIVLNFTNNNYYSGNINFEECVKSDFNNCIINLNIPLSNIDKKNVYKNLIHELTHLYELYQVRDIFDKTKWKNSRYLNNYDSLNLNINHMNYFRSLFYESLPHEIRAKNSSIDVLVSMIIYENPSCDINYVIDEVEKSSEFNRLNSLKTFDSELFLNKIIDDLGLMLTLRVFNLFNKVIKRNTILKTLNDLKIYLKKWQMYFNDCGIELEKRINKTIYIRFNKINNYKFENIHSFDEFNVSPKVLRNYRICDLLSPNYLDYI